MVDCGGGGSGRGARSLGMQASLIICICFVTRR